MVKGGKYRFRYTATDDVKVLIYIGRNFSGNGYWNQFELESKPGEVWSELTDEDLNLIMEV